MVAKTPCVLNIGTG